MTEILGERVVLRGFRPDEVEAALASVASAMYAMTAEGWAGGTRTG